VIESIPPDTIITPSFFILMTKVVIILEYGKRRSKKILEYLFLMDN